MQLQCACCGGIAPAKKQWFNQDRGYGVCSSCFRSAVEREVKILGEIEGWRSMLKTYGRPGVHHSVEMEPDLFHAVLVRDIPYDNHATDLFLPATPEVDDILKEFPLNDKTKTVFENQCRKGARFYDIPFAYLPAWPKRRN